MPFPADLGGSPVFRILGGLAEGERLKREDQEKREAEAFQNLFRQALTGQAEAQTASITEATADRVRGREQEGETIDSLAQFYQSQGLDPEAARARATFEARSKRAPSNIREEQAKVAEREATVGLRGAQTEQATAGAVRNRASAEESRARAEDVRTRGSRDPLHGLSGFERGQVRVQMREEAQEYVRRFGDPQAALDALDQQADAYLEALSSGQLNRDRDPDAPSAEELLQSYIILRSELEKLRLKKPRRGAVSTSSAPGGGGLDLSGVIPPQP